MKKQIVRFLGCLMGVAMLLAAFPAVSFGAAETEAPSLAVWGISEPVAGETPDYDAYLENTLTAKFDKSQDDGIVTINGIRWHSFNENGYISNTDTFRAGDNYTVSICLEMKDGYTLGSDTKCSVNGKSDGCFAMGTAGTNKVLLTYYFLETPYFVTSDNMATDIDIPEAGAHPDFDVKLSNDESYVREVRWYNKTDGRYLTEQDVFEAAHEYRIELVLIPAENYAFSTDEEGVLDYYFGFSFEGTSYEATIEGDETELIASYTFDLIPINSIDISLDEPMPGYSPNFLAYLDSDACIVKKMTWYDKTVGEFIDENDDYEFIQNHVYVAAVDVFTVGDAKFVHGVDATVNGLTADVGQVVYLPEETGNIKEVYSTTVAIRISYEFEPCDEKAFVTLEYDNHTHQILHGYSLPLAESEKLDNYLVYMAFYDGEGSFLTAVSKKTEFLADGFVEDIPQNAKSCKVMLWNKTDLMPLCGAEDMVIPESEL